MSKHRIGSLHTPVPAADSGAFRLGWLLYLVFIVYGSLVPLDFHALPLDQAWAQFRQLPMLQIGAEGRADWVANGVLYVPAGFLTVVVLGGGKGGLWRRFPRLAGAPSSASLLLWRWSLPSCSSHSEHFHGMM
ncbi:hypothetical protein [Candidatus Accumulibacter contiguus]|uniref:hypothetical protein n=1 Tax=Candidatus Accumulibacter contiguus TaxID=2954381 RepID=UPI00145FAF2C|nr:hypothetical protein [Candidatus Accumulibacter contiguus]